MTAALRGVFETQMSADMKAQRDFSLSIALPLNLLGAPLSARFEVVSPSPKG